MLNDTVRRSDQRTRLRSRLYAFPSVVLASRIHWCYIRPHTMCSEDLRCQIPCASRFPFVKGGQRGCYQRRHMQVVLMSCVPN